MVTDDSFATGEHECFCHRQYKDADKRQTCGDCPRNYIGGAWAARQKYLNNHEQPNILAS